MEERKLWLALSRVNKLGSVRFKLLVDYFGTASKVWNLAESELKDTGLPRDAAQEFLTAQRKTNPDSIANQIKEAGADFICSYEEAFPQLLKQIHDCPPVLFYKGNLQAFSLKTIGIVGTRKVSDYGKFVTEKFTSELVQNGFTIVSGLALGVDAIAHRTTLEMGGTTIAVLGSGLDKIGPVSNLNLAHQIEVSGGIIISEYFPETESNAGTFPARNRIISGVSLGVLITEGKEDSGSLITARAAVEQNREVFAVPGPINSINSTGPAKLIKEGAKLVTKVEDILEELNGISQNPKSKTQKIEEINFDSEIEKKIYESLISGEKEIDDIARETKLQIAQVVATLSSLEIKGLIRSSANRTYLVV